MWATYHYNATVLLSNYKNCLIASEKKTWTASTKFVQETFHRSRIYIYTIIQPLERKVLITGRACKRRPISQGSFALYSVPLSECNDLIARHHRERIKSRRKIPASTHTHTHPSLPTKPNPQARERGKKAGKVQSALTTYPSHDSGLLAISVALISRAEQQSWHYIGAAAAAAARHAHTHRHTWEAEAPRTRPPGPPSEEIGSSSRWNVAEGQLSSPSSSSPAQRTRGCEGRRYHRGASASPARHGSRGPHFVVRTIYNGYLSLSLYPQTHTNTRTRTRFPRSPRD